IVTRSPGTHLLSGTGWGTGGGEGAFNAIGWTFFGAMARWSDSLALHEQPLVDDHRVRRKFSVWIAVFLSMDRFGAPAMRGCPSSFLASELLRKCLEFVLRPASG